jgi:hypothetical protein
MDFFARLCLENTCKTLPFGQGTYVVRKPFYNYYVLPKSYIVSQGHVLYNGKPNTSATVQPKDKSRDKNGDVKRGKWLRGRRYGR